MLDDFIRHMIQAAIELFTIDGAKKAVFINRILSEQLKKAISLIELNKDAIERLVEAVMDKGNKKKYLTKKEIQEAAGELNGP